MTAPSPSSSSIRRFQSVVKAQDELDPLGLDNRLETPCKHLIRGRRGAVKGALKSTKCVYHVPGTMCLLCPSLDSHFGDARRSGQQILLRAGLRFRRQPGIASIVLR